MTRAIFFDLDDTLCNAQTAFRAGRVVAFNALLAERPDLDAARLLATWEDVHTVLFAALDAGAMTMAEVRRERFRRTLRILDLADDALADRVDLILGETQLRHLRLFPDATVLETLRERMPVGVITNGAGDAHPDSQRSKAAHLDLLDRVDSFWVSDETGFRKPDARAFQPGLASVGLAPTACVYVGDSIATDVAGAVAAGMRAALIWRDTTQDMPARINGAPDIAVIRSLLDLLDIM